MEYLCYLFLSTCWNGTISMGRTCIKEAICFHLIFSDLLLSWVAIKTTIPTVVFSLGGLLSFFQSRMAKKASNQNLQSQPALFDFFPFWMIGSSWQWKLCFCLSTKFCLISIGFQSYDSFYLPTANFLILKKKRYLAPHCLKYNTYP